MTLTITQARDEMSALFKETWDAAGYTVFWDDVGQPQPTSRTPWARFTIRHGDGFQATLANVSGVRRFRRQGTIFMQLFGPAKEGLSELDDMTQVSMRAYEGKTTPGGAWFRNARLQEIGVDGNWQQFNVLVDFEYDEVR